MVAILRANLITVATLDKWKAVFVNSFPAGATHIYESSDLSLVNYNGLCDSVFSYLHPPPLLPIMFPTHYSITYLF